MSTLKWTLAAIECYEKGCDCDKCSIGHILRPPVCQMRYLLPEIIRTVGIYDQATKEDLYQEIQRESIKMDNYDGKTPQDNYNMALGYLKSVKETNGIKLGQYLGVRQTKGSEILRKMEAEGFVSREGTGNQVRFILKEGGMIRNGYSGSL